MIGVLGCVPSGQRNLAWAKPCQDLDSRQCSDPSAFIVLVEPRFDRPTKNPDSSPTVARQPDK